MQDEREWLSRFASSLGERPPSREEIGAMLLLSRHVAHGVERKLAPLSTFVAGAHVARRATEGASTEEALREVREAILALVPEGAGPDLGGRPRGRGRRGWGLRRFGRRRGR